MSHDAAPYRSEAFAEDLIEPLCTDDRRLEWGAWSVVVASLIGLFWA